MPQPGDWQIERFRGSAAEFHAREVPDLATRQVWVFDVDRPAIALGSAQPLAHVDADACRSNDVDVVRRRSGGGAVLLIPDEIAWIDVIVPAADELWEADISRSGRWLGDIWVAAAAELTGRGDVMVHPGGTMNTTWSRHVCFAGLGNGEVTVGGAKLVGVSQRRTRHAARFQTAVHRSWDPARVCRLLAEPAPAPADLPDVATVHESIATIVDTFLGYLASVSPRR